ncbi:MAG: hypothetical protein II177_06590 [Lachnospiraceae bacterium]|jgi:hypothetical protein|nr:hypothetical protein [Lachnospiraceae bacterium]
MAIGSVGFGGVNPYSFKTQTKKTDDAKDTKNSDKTSQSTKAEVTNNAWATGLDKKVTSKQDVTDKTDDDQTLYTNGKTIGKPTLSKKATEYYEQLKKKFSNMNFVLVSEDQKANAQANAASFASQNKQTVLINEDKIEQMASDPEYAKKYENIIANSSSQLQDIQKQLEAKMGAGVLKGVGMQVLDNGATSFFATVRDQNKVSNEALQKRQAAKKAAKKAEAKKAAKKAEKEKAAEKSDKTDDTKKADDTQDTRDAKDVDETKTADADDDDFEYVEKNPDSDETGEVTPWDMYGTKTIYANSAEDLYKAVQGYLSGSSVYSTGNSVDYEG